MQMECSTPLYAVVSMKVIEEENVDQEVALNALTDSAMGEV